MNKNQKLQITNRLTPVHLTVRLYGLFPLRQASNCRVIFLSIKLHLSCIIFSRLTILACIAFDLRFLAGIIPALLLTVHLFCAARLAASIFLGLVIGSIYSVKDGPCCEQFVSTILFMFIKMINITYQHLLSGLHQNLFLLPYRKASSL